MRFSHNPDKKKSHVRIQTSPFPFPQKLYHDRQQAKSCKCLRIPVSSASLLSEIRFSDKTAGHSFFPHSRLAPRRQAAGSAIKRTGLSGQTGKWYSCSGPSAHSPVPPSSPNVSIPASSDHAIRMESSLLKMRSFLSGAGCRRPFPYSAAHPSPDQICAAAAETSER